MVYGHGINNIRGWASKSEENKKIYKTWCHMLERCYDEKYHKKYPTYKNCTVCRRWLLLSNFVDDFKLISGYDKEKFMNGELELDKDIKSNGASKEYSLENCTLISKSENIRQATKTRNNDYLQGENNHNYGKNFSKETRRKMSEAKSIKISQYDKQGNLIKIWCGSREIQRELGINQGDIIACCKWYACGEDLGEWHKIRKGYPNKTAGGFIFKYAIEE